jgi:hypothetical protein
MSEIKVSKISSLSAAQTLQIGGKGMMIGGTAENTTLIISTTAGGIPTVPHGDMSLFITDGTIQSTYGYQTTTGSIVGEFLGTYSNHPVGIMTNNAIKLFIGVTGNVGIGTTTPKVQLDVLGDINASASLTIAPAQLYTTQRTFTQVINTSGSNAANPVTAHQVIAGQTWLLGTFSEVNAAPAMFKFVHNTHTGSNIQSDSYEWSRTYIADAPASGTNPLAWSDWVELPVTTSVTYAAARQFRFDVRAQFGSGGGGGNMQLRLRASTPSSAYDGPHYFTFTTTGMANYTPETVFNVATAPTTLPTGFHGRQAYEFPVSKGTYGFAGSTAGVFILNNGNVGIGTTTPKVQLDVLGDINASASLTIAPAQLHTTERTFTQVFTANGSGNVLTVVGDAWLIGTFSDDYGQPGFFKFVHNSGLGDNLQSGSYEWTRSYVAEGLAVGSPPSSGAYTEWVELPVSISMAYGVSRNFRFDVRKNSALMQLRMRAMTAGMAGGAHYFTFTTTGSTTYTPAAGGAPTTTGVNTITPSGFHGRQSYEFPVSQNLVTNGYCGFTGSIAGLFILNGGNVGIGTVTPSVRLEVAGSIRPTGGTDLPAQVNNNAIFVGGSGSPDSGRIIIGDNSGWKYKISNRVGSVTTDLVTFMDTGNVGIGTTTPTAKLQTIASSNAARFGVSSSNSLTIGGRSSGPYASIGYNVNFDTNNDNQYFAVGADLTSLIRFHAGGFEFKGNTANGAISGTPFALTDLVTILNTGNVGIGTTTPGFKLEVAGAIRFNSEPHVVAAAASTTTGFRFGAIGATALTNYSGYTVKYTKTGNLATVEGLICNVSASNITIPSSGLLLRGLPTPKAQNAVAVHGTRSFDTFVSMYVYGTTAGDYALHMIAPAGITLAAGNGSVGGYIAVNFSYITT